MDELTLANEALAWLANELLGARAADFYDPENGMIGLLSRMKNHEDTISDLYSLRGAPHYRWEPQSLAAMEKRFSIKRDKKAERIRGWLLHAPDEMKTYLKSLGFDVAL